MEQVELGLPGLELLLVRLQGKLERADQCVGKREVLLGFRVPGAEQVLQALAAACTRATRSSSSPRWNSRLGPSSLVWSLWRLMGIAV
ncbi:hypothetical protein BX264_7134 [Streptomyces sp. 2333.5]|uniref:hypothetical protein n=1 Tax=unclassified Streptomyces TaxID=2593676 RepID=UPI000896E40B|nr:MULTISPECIES: hypothetical protein [unclassified Streptomyces]PJI99764.1 hypothetical protein BX264_0012 [Streptomyces sp. 2333.5]PJJ06592.1 hypothetical protein BX264_7134 [Streptomyces sp. 2333.5]SEB58512.1 hypothetical protein SAMN05428943_0012 [Streptomyces sp. 2314.4]SEC39189.1 hypothetical protein SAMN05428942_0012 [Streptomyces sp. 2112.2]SEF11420.1 hypothetical protein SAMN05428942_7235 [Streptomyces sp. 2112.2]